MKEPSVTEIKLAAGVPVESPFLGWLIHNPTKDDFLHAVRGSSGTFWTQTPETAKRFKLYRQAVRVLQAQELSDRALVVAAFDIGSRILVAAPNHQQQFLTESDNPFRNLASLLER
ncbi:hypothetical protein [Vibrio tarriae]|uniref:hypothetical protein n=1 Tax=Vibrio tarriae TaxID=2014742 RepID=UPI0001D5A811|nr:MULTISPECIES: hypothetical protein [Vibrio]EFH74847.1 predicted protein [Vibrio cholerae RC385]RBM32791.1 hypothetical protein DLR61_01360 [Vibrio tarriae]